MFSFVTEPIHRIGRSTGLGTLCSALLCDRKIFYSATMNFWLLEVKARNKRSRTDCTLNPPLVPTRHSMCLLVNEQMVATQYLEDNLRWRESFRREQML